MAQMQDESEVNALLQILDEEIEITDEMVAAGRAELWPCEVRPYQDEEEVLVRVFLAMLRLLPDSLRLNGQCELPDMKAAPLDQSRMANR